MHNNGLDTLPKFAADGADEITTTLKDPAASDWLRDALRTAMERDPVDAANDAEVLARLLEDRAFWTTGMARAMVQGF